MQLSEAIGLIQQDGYLLSGPSTWADLGCGTGLFTKALASLQPSGSVIYAIDTNQASLAKLTNDNEVNIVPIRQDFVRDDWPFKAIDGLLMANSLHYVADKPAFIEKASRYLTSSGCFLLVEYDTDTANPWVPYPLSFNSLNDLFRKAGYTSIMKLNAIPSLFRGSTMYSAIIKR